MTREEAIREEAIRVLLSDRATYKEMEAAVSVAIEALKERSQWIPCSERLPRKNGRYIVTEKRFAIDDRKHIGRYQTVVEEVNFSNNIWNRANFIEVVAWMPLPEPYEKAGE